MVYKINWFTVINIQTNSNIMNTETTKTKIWKVIFIISAVAFGALVHNSLNAQSGTVNKEKMKPLSVWVGKWTGEGWSMDESRQRTIFTVEENIQWKLDGLVMMAEGVGKDKASGKVGFHSFGVVYFNNEKNTYEMKSFLQEGSTTVAKASVSGNLKFVWGFDVQGGRIEYTTTIDGDSWHEKGAFILPSGQEFPVMEMNLTRSK